MGEESKMNPFLKEALFVLYTLLPRWDYMGFYMREKSKRKKMIRITSTLVS